MTHESLLEIICEKCGTEINSFCHYCPKCGYDLWDAVIKI